jgi:salicylate hydroxylase
MLTKVGINSFARSQLLGSSDPGTQPTGWAALRMMAEVSKIQQNPATADLVNLDSYNSNFWIAPDRSCMTYLIKDASMLNIVLSHRDDIDTANMSYEDHVKLVDELFGDFERP